MKCTTSEAATTSNESSGQGNSSARLCRTSSPGKRSRAAATNGADGSTAHTDPTPSRSTSRAVSAPGPQPTSNARRPGARASNGTSSSVSGSEYRPMNRP